MRILVTTNNFWVGGRETFLSTYLSGLARFGVRADLIASSIFAGTPDLSGFDTAVACPGESASARCRAWLLEAERIVPRRRPDLIWAQHFDVLPAWLVSRRYGIPLVTTFHGPLVGAGRPNEPMQALGMTLALGRGECISGVSEEVLGGIRALCAEGMPQVLIPNSVDLGRAGCGPACRGAPRTFTLVTRSEKLGHIRSAVLFLHAYRRATGHGRLVIAAGLSPRDSVTPSTGLKGVAQTLRATVRGLGARWCWDLGPAIVPTLLNIVWYGYSSAPRQLLDKGDAVLGMGRVVLEGLAGGKPVVLIGYDRICGTVTPGKFEDYRRANFSGRGVPAADPAEAVAGLLEFCRGTARQLPEHLDLVSADRCAGRLHELLQGTAARRIAPSDECADALCRLVMDPACRDEALFSAACGRLDPKELASFYLVSKG